ncbi:MAG: flagellar hook-basal body complex protein [Armatimonadota bacterium]
MIRAFYSGASALVARALQQDTIANNIANANTPGFRKSRVITQSFEQELEGSFASLKFRQAQTYPDSPQRAVLVGVKNVYDYSPANLEVTGNKFDIALQGPGQIQLNGAGGNKFTRSTKLVVDSAGELATSEGTKVLGRNGTIKVPNGEWEIDSNGNIVSDGAVVDTLRITGRAEGQTKVLQGHIETGNVSVVKEMASMIANFRAFEAAQKAIQLSDESLDKLVNEVGRIA